MTFKLKEDREEVLGLLFVNGFKTEEGGGDIDLNSIKYILSKISGINISEVSTIAKKEFNFLSLFEATMHGLLSDISKQGKIDLIVSESPFPPQFLYTLRYSIKFKIPAVIFMHHHIHLTFHPLHRGILRSLLYCMYDNIILALSKINGFVVSIDIPSEIEKWKIGTLKNELAIPWSMSSNDSDLAIKKDYDLCYVGRFQKHKGSKDLVKCMYILKRKGYNLRIAIIGKIEKKQKHKIDKKLKKLNLVENFHFLGWLSENMKLRTMKGSNLYISLSYEEGWGLSVMEAAALGLPIIAYDIPAYKYLEGNLFSAKPGNIEEVCNLIIWSLENDITKDVRVMNAREIVKKYNFQKIALQHLDFYIDLLKKMNHHQSN